jgi:DNA topoisomerase-2
MDIVNNIRRFINGQIAEPMIPWYRGFTGSIIQDSVGDGFRAVGKAYKTSLTTLEIVELPVGMWTKSYKDNVLDQMVTKKLIIGYI